jgi:hypothetical protein
MTALRKGGSWPPELGYLAEYRALREMGFVGSLQEFEALPAMVRGDMRLVAEMQAAMAKHNAPEAGAEKP